MQYKVVRHSPKQNMRQLAVGAMALVICLLIGFASGQWFGKEAIFENGALIKQLTATTDENQQLQKQLVAAELAANVQEQAARELRAQLSGVLSEKAELEEAVSFYRDLMEVGSEAEGLRVADLALFSTGTPSVYQFSVLITQVAENRKYVGGDVTIKVIGLKDEQRQTITFSQDNAVVGYPLKFRFRYFQDLIGQLKLPDGFRPERVSIDVRQRNKPPISADFEWLVQQA